MKHYRRKTNRRIVRLQKRLDKIETALRLKHQCILCGFDQGPPKYCDCGRKVPKEILDKINLTGTAGPKCSTCGKPAVGGQGTALQATIHFCKDHRPTAGEYQGPKHEVIPPMQMDYSDSPIHKTAGECTCPHIVDFGGRPIEEKPYSIINPFCLIHGKSALYCSKCGDRLVQAYESGRLRCPRCLVKEMSGIPDVLRGTPDLPLHARVAKALGKDVSYSHKEPTQGWYITSEGYTSMSLSDIGWVKAIPDYPNDLVAAMGALEEYKKTNQLRVNIELIEVTDQGMKWLVLFDERAYLSHRKQIRYLWDSCAQAICEAIVADAEGK